jgi:hypothetical protein
MVPRIVFSKGDAESTPALFLNGTGEERGRGVLRALRGEVGAPNCQIV